eukprot:178650_1
MGTTPPSQCCGADNPNDTEINQELATNYNNETNTNLYDETDNNVVEDITNEDTSNSNIKMELKQSHDVAQINYNTNRTLKKNKTPHPKKWIPQNIPNDNNNQSTYLTPY